MDRAMLVGLLEKVCSVDASCRDREVLVAGAAAVSRLRGWLDARDLAIAAALEDVASFPQDALARAARCSMRDAARTVERAGTVAKAPAFAHALAGGQLSAAHVDELTRAFRHLEPAERELLAADAPRLAGLAGALTPERFRRALDAEVRALQPDDGMSRLRAQRRAVRLRVWTDGNGMWNLAGQFDPDAGAQLERRLQGELQRRFSDTTPDDCPSDPLEKQAFLRGHALLSLTSGTGPRVDAEIVAVVHTVAPPPPAPDDRSPARPSAPPSPPDPSRSARSPSDRALFSRSPTDRSPSGCSPSAPSPSNGSSSGPLPSDRSPVGRSPFDPSRSDASAGAPASTDGAAASSSQASGGVRLHPRFGTVVAVDWGLDAHLPLAVLDEHLARGARIRHIVLAGTQIVSAPGRLDLGRTRRTANRAQRRALRALYRTCAIPGCTVRFAYTDIHHVLWWERNGRTDLDNLLPLCSRHHHAVHDGGWRLTLLPDRTLRVEMPDGRVMTTGPPSAWAA